MDKAQGFTFADGWGSNVYARSKIQQYSQQANWRLVFTSELKIAIFIYLLLIYLEISLFIGSEIKRVNRMGKSRSHIYWMILKRYFYLKTFEKIWLEFLIIRGICGIIFDVNKEVFLGFIKNYEHSFTQLRFDMARFLGYN